MTAGISVQFHGDGRIAELVLDRAEALNALSTSLLQALHDTTGHIAADPRIRALMLTSRSDRAFCVGADLKERADFGVEELLEQRSVIRRAFDGIRGLPVPSIAALHGYALGGGLELALSCDLVVADTTAVVGQPEVSVGLVPGGGGTQLLTRRVGRSRAADLIFTGRRVDAAEAERLGLLDRLVPAGQARDSALELATTIAANSPTAVRHAKQALVDGADVELSTALEVEDAAWRASAVSADRREGIAAFVEKRTPQWNDQATANEG